MLNANNRSENNGGKEEKQDFNAENSKEEALGYLSFVLG